MIRQIAVKRFKALNLIAEVMFLGYKGDVFAAEK